MSRRSAVAILIVVALAGSVTTASARPSDPPPDRTEPVRIATFNASLNRAEDGQLVEDLADAHDDDRDRQVRAVAEIIQRVRPDILLINEFDFDADGEAAQLFQDTFLSVGWNGADPITYPHVFQAPSNTGIPTGFDLDNNGEVITEVSPRPDAFVYAGDAQGFGEFPGQFGMLVLSQHPIEADAARTFQQFLWKDMPGALLPDDPDTPEPADWYSAEELDVLRLSSKSHWDVPVATPGGTVHLLAAHPTPPVFDGPEDRNGRRNHDEIRFWADYVHPDPGRATYVYDDQGERGGLAPGERFVVVGDYNADPNDGDGIPGAANQLLDTPGVFDPEPTSTGGVWAAGQGEPNEEHETDPALDTADFAEADFDGPGNLRVDYVLPSRGLPVRDAGVFWPAEGERFFRLTGPGFPPVSSDHRLVWVDVKVTAPAR